MEIHFTEFLLPDGRKRDTAIERPNHIADIARDLNATGCRFEIEVLTTGEVSMEVVLGERVLAGRICPNGSDVPKCVDEIVMEALRTLIRERQRREK